MPELLKSYCVYILTNREQTVLYTGVTGDLPYRLGQHKQRHLRGFTRKYHVDRLVYFQSFGVPSQAIAREKQIKGWSRRKKVELVTEMNPEWRDLYEDVIRSD